MSDTNIQSVLDASLLQTKAVEELTTEVGGKLQEINTHQQETTTQLNKTLSDSLVEVTETMDLALTTLTSTVNDTVDSKTLILENQANQVLADLTQSVNTELSDIPNIISTETDTIKEDLTAVLQNQRTGVLTFPTHDLLIGYTVPEEEIKASFKVTRDTDVTKNGYYSYDGTNFIMDSTTVIGFISGTNNSDSVSGKAVVDYLNGDNNGLIIDTKLLTGPDSDMSQENSWKNQLGNANITFDDSGMVVEFISGENSNIILDTVSLKGGQRYLVQVKLNVISGNPSTIQVGGHFSSNPPSGESIEFEANPGDSYYLSKIITVRASGGNPIIGCASGGNAGATISISEVNFILLKGSVSDLEAQVNNAVTNITGNLLNISSSKFLPVNSWEHGLGTPVLNYQEDGGAILNLSKNTPSNISYSGILEIGKEYTVKVTCKLLSETPVELFIGGLSSSSPHAGLITPTNEFVEYTRTFIPNTEDFTIGSVILGVDKVISISSVYLIGTAELLTLTPDISSIEKRLTDIESGNILSLQDSTMTSDSNWVSGIGNPVLDFDTTPNSVIVEFSLGTNSQIYLNNHDMVIGVPYRVTLDIQLISGTSSKLTVGMFASASGEELVKFNPTDNVVTESGIIVAGSPVFSIGCISSENKGCVVAITNVVLTRLDSRIGTLERAINTLTTINPPNQVFNASSFMNSLSKYDKPLTKFGVVGDSLMANNVGGVIPVDLDEGVMYRPIRLDINSVPRRIYDHLAFNKAQHVRLDALEWVKSGLWAGVNDSSVWEPLHTETLYHKSTEANSYVELIIPDGKENFAVVCQQDTGFGSLDITLNGGDISTYGLSTIILDRDRVSSSDLGNPYYTVEYHGLPAGVNTVRIAKQADTKECRIWGGFYWSGNTLVLHNIAHGGHALTDLITNHLDAELLGNDFDAILFEIPIMNEMSHGRSLSQTVTDLSTVVDDYLVGKDVMFMTPNPFGLNSSGTNYYANFNEPSMEDSVNACTTFLTSVGVPYINVFDMFKGKISNRGGSLAGGEGGSWYTTDGQHPNPDGCREWFNLIRPHLNNKPFNSN